MATALWSPVARPREPLLVPSDPHELGAHHLLLLVDEQVKEPGAHHHVLPQRDGTVLLDDDRGVTPHLPEPLAELLRVADGGRQGDESYDLRQMEDDLLPDCSSHAVREVVHLVHDDVPEVG